MSNSDADPDMSPGSPNTGADPTSEPSSDDTPADRSPVRTPAHSQEGQEPSAGPPAPGRFAALTDRTTSTANTPSPGAVGPHAAAETADERGTLAIEDIVVEKVATAAAGEVDGIGGAARRVLGVPTGTDDGDGRPRVSARVTGQTAALEVRITVAYPASVRATTEAVRTHVRDRVHALTELTITRVDITIAALTSTKAGARRVIA